jgi:hypothetical protein
MQRDQPPQLDLDAIERTLSGFSEAARTSLVVALNEAALHEPTWRDALRDPDTFLRGRGIDLPNGIEARLSSETGGIRWPQPDPPLDLVVVRSFWWCYREDGGPRTCVFVSLEVPASLISFS